MNNKFPKVTLIFDRYKKASIYYKASVEIRITYNYRQKYISTGISLYPKQWKKGMVVNTPNAMELNRMLSEKLEEVNKVVYRMFSRGNFNILSISDRLGVREDDTSFIEFCEQRTVIRKYEKSDSRQKRYDYFLRLFKDWGVISTFEDITEQNIITFDTFLKKRHINDYTKWHNYHEFLNSFIIEAIDAGYISRNPYKWVRINRGECSNGLDKCLTPTQFKKLIKTKMPTESLERVRDLFVFQTYTCLRYSDLALFDASYIKGVDGMKTYIRNSRKTKKPFVIPLLPTVLKILEKYHNKLPIISNVKYNLYLKSVAQAAGLDIPLSTHWARHTGATLLLNEGVDMRIVSKICGHSSTRMTEQIYAKLLDETVVKAVRKVKGL